MHTTCLRFFRGAVTFTALIAFELSSCSDQDDCHADDDCPPGHCMDPTTQPCAIGEKYGVFVSAKSGSDGGDGTRQAPYKTIGKGLTEAKAKNKRVYVCSDGS